MTLKRARLIVFACLIAMAVILILGKCMPTDVSADPIGPPSIETHLININANMSFIKWMMGVVGALLSALIGVMMYAYKRDLAAVNSKADKALTKTDDIEENFLSIKSFELWLAGGK